MFQWYVWGKNARPDSYDYNEEKRQHDILSNVILSKFILPEVNLLENNLV
jgi:hypothetical protein